MRRLAFFVGFLVSSLLSTKASAQQPNKFVPPPLPVDTSKLWIFKDVTVGPYFSGGFSEQNANLPTNWKTLPRFAFNVGGTVDFYYSQWLGLDFSMIYDSRDFYLDTASANIDVNLGYLVIEPSVRLLWLLLGISLDFPLSGSAIEKLDNYHRADNPKINSYDENLNIQTSDLQTFAELRATLSVPIFENASANLHFLVTGGYPLSKTIAGTSSFDTTGHTKTSGITGIGRFSGSSQPGNGPLPTVQAGLSYQFDALH